MLPRQVHQAVVQPQEAVVVAVVVELPQRLQEET